MPDISDIAYAELLALEGMTLGAHGLTNVVSLSSVWEQPADVSNGMALNAQLNFG